MNSVAVESGGRVACALTLAFAACGTGQAPVSARPQPAPACVIEAAAPAADRLTVALLQPVDPAHAPAPHNAAERLLFRQLYEPLVHVDCEGNVLTGLAASWAVGADGRRWQFRLRDDAVLWDGSPVSPSDVSHSWAGSVPAAAHVNGVFSEIVTNSRELHVELRVPVSAALFAHADVAFAKPAAGAAWPRGSGTFRITAADARMIRIERTNAVSPRIIEFRVMSGNDARAPLDAGVDMLVTADPATLDYARALRDYTITALPWDRTYTLVTRAPPTAADTMMGPSTDVLRALARDAVRADTRVAETPFWWQDPACGTVARPAPRATGARNLIYPRGDVVARDIAERLAALAYPVSRAPTWLRALLPADYATAGATVALALDERALLDSLRNNRGLGYVVPMPRRAEVSAACSPTPRTDRVPAVRRLQNDGWRITPLLDAREQLIHRRNTGRLIIDADGIIRFGGGP